MSKIETPIRLDRAKEDTTELLNHPLLAGISLESLVGIGNIEQYDQTGEVIFEEGDLADKLYIILEGDVEVVKIDTETGQEFRLATLHQGDYIGETALFAAGNRSATLKTLRATRLLVLKTDNLQKQSWYSTFLHNVASGLNSRLSLTNEVTVTALRNELKEASLRLSANKLLLYMILVLSMYSIGVALAVEVATNPILSTIINTSLYLIFGGTILIFIISSPYPLSFYGLVKPKDWRKDLYEALVWTVGLIIVASILRYIAYVTIPGMEAYPMFYRPWVIDPNEIGLAIVISIIYCIFVPVQELCVRGVLQSLLYELFDNSKWRLFVAILLSNALFAAAHSHLSVYFALTVFLPGCVWGLLYARQQSLFGVTINHLIVGVWSLRVVGMMDVVEVLQR